MRCVECKKGDTKVIDSRDDEKTIRRRRECLKCGYRFTTYEKVEEPVLRIQKRDGRIENFDKEKIRLGIMRALEKRPIEDEILINLVDEIERQVILLGEKTVPSIKVGEIVSAKLKTIDEVAYLRFISVYKSFSSAESFESEAKKLTIKRNKK
jgi:transcriptional repressor NrdR